VWGRNDLDFIDVARTDAAYLPRAVYTTTTKAPILSTSVGLHSHTRHGTEAHTQWQFPISLTLPGIPVLPKQTSKPLKFRADREFSTATLVEVDARNFVGNENAKAWRALRGMLFKNYHNAPNASNEETPMGDDASALFDSLKRMQLDAENKRQAHDFGQKEGKKEKYGKPPLTDVDILRSMQTL
jgi:hypothetical protein